MVSQNKTELRKRKIRVEGRVFNQKKKKKKDRLVLFFYQDTTLDFLRSFQKHAAKLDAYQEMLCEDKIVELKNICHLNKIFFKS